MQEELRGILNEVLGVKADRNYWFIRTQGGFFYRLFVERGIVAIGYTKVDVPEPADGEKPRSIFKAVVEEVKKRYPDARWPGQIAKQVITFTKSIGKGDVVIIPGVNSQYLSFGIVIDDVAKDTVVRDEDNAFDLRVRSVQWIKTVPKRSLNPNLFSMFFAHQTISNGNEYGTYIDNTLNDFFIKDEKAYLQLPVQKNDDINARALFKTCLDLLDLTDEFLEYMGSAERTKAVEVKVNINSPGVVEFIGYSLPVIAVLGLLIVAINGGGFKTKNGEGMVELKSDGLLSKLTEFLNEKSKRKALETMVQELQSLEMKDSKDIVKVIDKLVK